MFDLNAASDKITTSYQQPGIANVKITGVLLEETGTNKVPYIVLTTESEAGELGKSGRMFLSTEVKEGKKTSGWAVTARNLVDIIVAAKGKTEEEAKSMISVQTKEELVNKLSAILVGSKLRAKFKGEISDKGTIFATLAQVESLLVPQEESKLRFNADRDIKPSTNTSTQIMSSGPAVGADLPF